MDKEKIIVIPDTDVFKAFLFKGEITNCKPLGNGHINLTFLVTTSTCKYVLQKVNTDIFKDVQSMNNNISKALAKIDSYQQKHDNHRFEKLYIINTISGKNHFTDNNGCSWRLMNYIDDSVSVDVVNTPEIAYAAASSFGYFQKCLLDLDVVDFKPSIPDFHNLRKRVGDFEVVLINDPVNRKKTAIEEIDFALERTYFGEKLANLFNDGIIPQRITHNDTKVNNVLLDKNILKGKAVIDLDTVMPGSVLFDFGDMVRTFTSPAAEDETDLTKVVFRKEIYYALKSGYLSELNGFITEGETCHLMFGAKVMLYMIGVRFLTDYLSGDKYFKTSHQAQNLDRCRTQFKLLEEIEEFDRETPEI